MEIGKEAEGVSKGEESKEIKGIKETEDTSKSEQIKKIKDIKETEEISAEKIVDDLNKKAEARKYSVKEAASYSLMDGFGLRYITPYALALKATTFQIGLLSSLPALFANFSMIFTPKLMEKHSRKNIVFTGIFLQALLWLAFIALGVGFFYFRYERYAGISLVVVYTILILVGAMVGPAWSSWMKDITEDTNKGAYFGRRSKIAGSIALVCMLIGGFVLDYFEKTHVFIGFTILFVLAFIGRLGSSFYLRKQYEPKWQKEEGYYFSFINFVKRMHSNNYGRFVLTTAIMAFAVSFASPFLAVYMLQDLGFSYIQFTIVTLSASAVALLVMSKWGRFADKYGNIKVMRMTGILVASLPLVWFVSSFFGEYKMIAFVYLFIEEAIAGFAWAGYNLSAGNFIYDAVSKPRMALCVAYFSIIHGILAFFGATLGGWVASLEINFLGFNAILIVFALSFVMRIGALALINKNIKEVRPVLSLGKKEAREEFRALMPINWSSLIGHRIFKNKPY